MAFQQSSIIPRQSILRSGISQDSTRQASIQPTVEESQEWILFSPSQFDSSTSRTPTSQTLGLSRASDLGSFNTAGRSGRLESDVLDEDVGEDAELDSLDEGLHAFREPPLYHIPSNQTSGAVLPTHDGLGMFPASSPPVLEQLWQYEQYNPKRKHSGAHRRTSSVQKRLSTVEEMDAEANEEKRLRIEKWRMDQSQAMLEDVERETRRNLKRSTGQQSTGSLTDEILGTTPKQSDYMPRPLEQADEPDSLWRRITRKFIRDVIGIDEPLLSVILGESLPEDALSEDTKVGDTVTTPEPGSQLAVIGDDSWRDRLLQRIARELGVYVHQLSPHPHPGAFTTYTAQCSSPDYAGIPVIDRSGTLKAQPRRSHVEEMMKTIVSDMTSNFRPTVHDPVHAESWGFDDEALSKTSAQAESSLNLQQEREYWERELDVKMVFRFLRNRFLYKSSDPQLVQNQQSTSEDTARRTAIVRQYHPLVARAHGSTHKLRRESRLSVRRPTSSCASESVKGSRKASLVRSGSSSRNYWDIGGSIGSGSMMASGGLMGAWGEA